jgi:L-amino acid N-acyltransferase YncA
MTILVRDANEADITAVHAIYAHYVRHSVATFEYEVPSLEEMVQRWRAVLACYLVAVEQERVLGYGYASSFRTRAGYLYTVEDSIYVHPDAQRRGVGTALLAALIAHCERGPWRQMIAVIGDSANAGSVALHARAGFTLIGTQRSVGFKHGRWVDTVEMQRALGAGDGTLP